MTSSVREKIKNPGSEELYEIALDRERMRIRERESRRHSELLLQGLQILTISETSESALFNILLALNRSETLAGSFVLVSGPGSHFDVFSSTLPEFLGTRWYPAAMFTRMFHQGKPIIVHDPGQMAEWKDKPDIAEKYRSAAHAPFRFGRSRAAIVCVSRKHGFINYMHAKLLYRLGPLLTQALLTIENIKELENTRAQLEEKSQQLAEALGKATYLAQTDHLTQVLNRRSFFEIAAKKLHRCCELNLPLSLFILDVDDFKAINDNFGHSTGDSVLTELAALCRSVLRSSDVLARYGGEEFVVLLPEATKDQALNVAERMRQAVMNARLDGLPDEKKVTLNIGVAEKNSPSASIDTLIDQADLAMLEAKKRGKNQIVLHPF